jgi:hypothetical protein
MPQGGAPFCRLPILGQAIADTGRSLLLVGAKTLLIPAIRPVRAVRGALGDVGKMRLAVTRRGAVFRGRVAGNDRSWIARGRIVSAIAPAA